MAKKPRQRISYVLPLPSSSEGHRQGHRLGVNALAVDSEQAVLYSGGRDGSLCAWDLDLDLSAKPPSDKSSRSSSEAPRPRTCTTFRTQTQAHTHWVNDIVLVQENTALVSASSDLTVKVWRPWFESEQSDIPQTIGLHTDYVKCVATRPRADWVAAGGLDRRIILWDINGAGKRLEIEVADEDKSDKGSVYALSAGRSILASGGPESIVRLWDSRTGRRITKLVGHTDNVRDILLSETGDTIMTASSDQTVKVWSITAGRCMHTLTMHNDSVWALFSADPQLSVFYSSDRSGLVAKTDVRGTFGEMDNGLSLAISQEHEGVNRLIACGGHIWTATSSSSINRWPDVDTGTQTGLPEPFKTHRASNVTSKHILPPTSKPDPGLVINSRSILRISNTARYPTSPVKDTDIATIRLNNSRETEIIGESDFGPIVPIHNLPQETIEGQHGFIKHKIMNDRIRALTLDTAGEVVLWDLLRCIPIQAFGKGHLEEVEQRINTLDAIATWCSVDTRTGLLTVVLEEYNCFDAEMYADELPLDEAIEFREDQRINLGKWVIRHLFSRLIDEIIKRDEQYRGHINATIKGRKSAQHSQDSISIQIPAIPIRNWQDTQNSATTPRANGVHQAPVTPSMNIGVATPGAAARLQGFPEDGAALNKQPSHASRPSIDRSGDYFSTLPVAQTEGNAKPPTSPGEPHHDEKSPTSPSDPDKETNGKDTSIFGKKFRMGMSFGSKKRAQSSNTEKSISVDEKIDDGRSSSSETSEHMRGLDYNLRSVVQRIRNDYDRATLQDPLKEVECLITPSLPTETPVLKIPPATSVILQTEAAGGYADQYRGTVGSVGEDARVIEERAPTWLGELLLRNKMPYKDPVKVSFTLLPYQDLLPSIAGPDGNNRLNANRMLRVKKVLAYVAERLEPRPEEQSSEAEALKPEEYLELYCNDQLLSTTITLATLRTHIWKGGPDIALFYKSNGRISFHFDKPVESDLGGPYAASTAA